MTSLMCGLVGVYSQGPPPQKKRLLKALDTLTNRGPDGCGVWWSSDGRVGLGHRRLAITRPEFGEQPVVQESCTVAVNGQFYDLDEEFRARSDSYAVPTLYRRYGLQPTLDRLRGEFAFLLYDHPTQTFLAVRDRFGIKPLFWARREEEWWFASKPSALWAAGIEPGWCEDSFLHAAATQYPPPGQSLFAGIRSVRPAHFIRLQRTDSQETRYWRVPPLHEKSDAKSHVCSVPHKPSYSFGENLAKCVELRLRNDGPTAVLLSGGVDSAGVLGLAARTGGSLKAYTVDFPATDGYSEAERATEQARLCGVPHRVIAVTPQDVLREHADAVRSTEGLAVNGHLVAKTRLAQAIAEDGIQVVLTGEGSDELLFGYRHFAPYFGQTVNPLEDTAGLGILTSTQAPELPTHYPHFFHSKVALGRRIHQLLGRRFEARPTFDRIMREAIAKTDLEKAREAWNTTALATYILEVLGDGTEMIHSLEGRPPFLDHTLWDMGILPDDGQKTLLRQYLGGLVTDEISRRPKHPFMAPSLGDGLLQEVRKNILDIDHAFVDKTSALETLGRVSRLSKTEQLEWEPALLWVLSSYALQELWT